MSDELLVSTRKGLFLLRKRRSGWSLEQHWFLGDKLSLSHVDRRDGSWYAALDLGHFGVKLRRSCDRGESWQECAVPNFTDGDTVCTGDGKPPQPAAMQLLWCLQAGTASQPGRLWAGTIPGGLFRSDDHGQSWRLLRSLWDRPERNDWFGGGYDFPGIHSICIDPRDPRVLRIAISCGGVWQSDDDGDNWRLCADGMIAEYMPRERRADPNIQDPHRMVQCAAAPDVLWVQHHNGVFRSMDGAKSWSQIRDLPPSSFGFAVAVHPQDPHIAWFVPAVKDECRVPVNGRLVVTRTLDGGKRFETLRKGLPREKAFDLIYRHALAIDDTGERLAFGSTSGGLWISENQGDQWSKLGARLPPILAVEFVPN